MGERGSQERGAKASHQQQEPATERRSLQNIPSRGTSSYKSPGEKQKWNAEEHEGGESDYGFETQEKSGMMIGRPEDSAL